MIIKVGGGLEPLGPIGVYAYDGRQKEGERGRKGREGYSHPKSRRVE